MIPPPIDPATGQPAQFTYEDYVAIWRSCRAWVRHRKNRRLARQMRALTDAELSEIGFLRSNPWR
jgi:uncharacterized protein YjiS (DUF1127 family)